MAYAAEHNLLTVHWNSIGTEKGQFGLRFAGATLPTQSLVDACAGAVSTMWASSTANIWNGYGLAFLRLARIGTDGLYVPGSISYDHNYSPVVGGGVAVSAPIFPLQVAMAVSLRTAEPRGLAHVGRFYMPPICQAVASDGLWPVATVNSRNNTVAAMLSALNAVGIGTLSVMSKGGKGGAPGLNRTVTFINSDTRPDVQRRRSDSTVRVLAANQTV